MARRLAQLQAALGCDDSGNPTNPAQALTAAPVARPARLTLVSACLISAALGAGAMWLATPGAAPGTSPSMVAVPVASPPPQPDASAGWATSAITSDEIRIEAVLEKWRQAWSERNLAGYLDTYGTGFIPADGSSRADWVAARTKMLLKKSAIKVGIRDVSIERMAADRFKVSFRQDYESGKYRESGRAKTLNIEREDGGWKIVGERQD